MKSILILVVLVAMLTIPYVAGLPNYHSYPPNPIDPAPYAAGKTVGGTTLDEVGFSGVGHWVAESHGKAAGAGLSSFVPNPR